jgi:choline dehydrogenase-like flavoprotein
MGSLNDPMVVCDPRLRVRGVASLRDASVFPMQTSGNINAPSILAGEKGGALILEDWLEEAVWVAAGSRTARM